MVAVISFNPTSYGRMIFGYRCDQNTIGVKGYNGVQGEKLFGSELKKIIIIPAVSSST